MTVPINVDFDGPQTFDDLSQNVTRLFLQKQLRMECQICMSPYDETLAQLELFSLPAVLVYDQQGKLLDRIEGDVDYERDIIPLIEAASKE